MSDFFQNYPKQNKLSFLGAASLLPQPKILSNVEKESCDLEPAQVPGKRDEMAENKISDVLPSKSDTKTPTVIEKSIPSLVKYLKQFNSDEEIRNFDLAVFPCNVCFAEKMGSQSIRFPGQFSKFFYQHLL